ncbi:MAG: 16S rRNA (adenine(1518)-N(6)/adenine(1519)-N(6))-dimethyltransferase, partial [Woeseiaceae bacterium]|nr:16S rRNA (adenine(1518)-N(6)/adenine(1519)-N(6))-dimethyltransferase [Woeseiaceae bacterium]
TLEDEDALSNLLASAFTQPSKTLRKSLASHDSPEELEALGIDPGLRPENLKLHEWHQIAALQ